MKAKYLTYMERKLYEPKWYEVARAIIGNIIFFLILGIGGGLELMLR